eukprot:638242-Prymnesium_polylepis.1
MCALSRALKCLCGTASQLHRPKTAVTKCRMKLKDCGDARSKDSPIHTGTVVLYAIQGWGERSPG